MKATVRKNASLPISDMSHERTSPSRTKCVAVSTNNPPVTSSRVG